MAPRRKVRVGVLWAVGLSGSSWVAGGGTWVTRRGHLRSRAQGWPEIWGEVGVWPMPYAEESCIGANTRHAGPVGGSGRWWLIVADCGRSEPELL